MANMRESDPLITQLKQWGHAHVNRYAYTRADRCVHALEQARDLAPGTRERAERDLVGRDGLERRQLMASHSGVKGLKALPKWAVDPVPARNDASLPHDNPEIAVDMGIPEDLRWLDRAIVALARQNPIRERIVRTEFTVSASQAVKAKMVEQGYGGKLTVWQYRRELERSIEWISGRSAV